MLVLIPKVPKIQRPKALKIDVFDNPTFDAPSPHKAYIARNWSQWASSSPPSVGLSSFKFML